MKNEGNIFQRFFRRQCFFSRSCFEIDITVSCHSNVYFSARVEPFLQCWIRCSRKSFVSAQYRILFVNCRWCVDAQKTIVSESFILLTFNNGLLVGQVDDLGVL